MATTVVQTQVGGAMRNWSTGLFDCFSDMSICLCGCFCQLCLVFNTASEMGENGCCLAFCIPCPYNQMLLRVKLRSENRIQGSICDDYCAATCCQLCSLCQVAREVKYVRMNGGAAGQQQVTVVTTQPTMAPMAVQPAPVAPPAYA